MKLTPADVNPNLFVDVSPIDVVLHSPNFGINQTSERSCEVQEHGTFCQDWFEGEKQKRKQNEKN